MRTFLIMIMVSVLSFSCLSGEIENRKALRAKDKYERSLKKIKDQYVKELKVALKDALKNEDLEDAILIKEEINAFDIDKDSWIIGTWKNQWGDTLSVDKKLNVKITYKNLPKQSYESKIEVDGKNVSWVRPIDKKEKIFTKGKNNHLTDEGEIKCVWKKQKEN